MTKYRFKTKEEFIRDGRWVEKFNAPYGWASQGGMNKYLGKDVPDEYIVYCDKNEEFKYDGWLFQNTDYTLKEQEYFDDLSQHIGRYIRALVDNPHSGVSVKKGDIGKITNFSYADFPNFKNYACSTALRKDYLGTRYELLPENYSPKQENVPERISFYVKYTEEFTEDLYNALWEWSKKNSEFSPRNFADSYEGLKKHKFYVFNNWTFNPLNKYGGIFPEKYSYGVDNNKQSCEKEYSIEQVKKLIGYKEPNIEFIPSKWYSFNWDWNSSNSIVVAKIKEVTDINIIVSWRNSTWNKADYNINDCYNLSEISNVKELSIDEVQQYLPEGHIDKFCETCNGEGETMIAKLYPSGHTEVTDTCPDCNGTGFNNNIYKIQLEEFKKGEYIVITDNYSGGFCTNYIYKQKKDYKYLQAELDNYGSTTNGFSRYEKKNPYNWRYATQEEIDEYERRGKPYDVTELQKKELSMKEIQEECKKKYPIGCTYISTSETECVLKKDSYTYSIVGKTIWAHLGGGYLYEDGKWADLVSLPEENITEIPEYVECVSYDSKNNGKIFNTKNDKSISEINSWEDILIKYDRLKDGSFKISNKEAYEKQKNWLGSPEESFSRLTPTLDPYEGTITNLFVYDEVRQYPLTPSECWKNIPKFEEQNFDIYGPTPDIN